MKELDNQNFEPSKEQISEFISQYKRYEGANDFSVNSRLSTEFNNIGHPELAKRWAYAFLKKQIDECLQGSGVSHTLMRAYEVLAHEAKMNGELTKGLGEMLAKLYESSGRFPIAYELYRDNCPEKYADKLASVVLNIEEQEGIVNKEDQWRSQIPDSSDQAYFPDFKKVDTKDLKQNEKSLFEDFLKTVPRAIIEIDTKAELKALLDDAKKIAEGKLSFEMQFL